MNLPNLTFRQGMVAMVLDLTTVEALSPDQASLKAASKLIKPGKWPQLARNETGSLVWGECQGSGANPYRVVADADDHGYKCTCPSRKFPCKHALALMWMYAESGSTFQVHETPEWVTDWLGRRRKTAGQARPETAAKGDSKDLRAARKPPEEVEDDPKAAERRAAAARKRAEATERSIRDGLDELEQWIADQLRLGLTGFLQDFTSRCRKIAARLVDAKAAGLAGRIDEMPARLMALPNEDRLDGALSELGKLVLLAHAWRAEPRRPDLWRTVATAETREQVLSDPNAERVSSIWEVLGEQIETRRDGLVSQSTWLLDLKSPSPRFALLLDFFPASAGRRERVFTGGERFAAELVFYPGARPLRALIAERHPGEQPETVSWPHCDGGDDPLALFADALDAEPWALAAPILLPPGRICERKDGTFWWRDLGGASGLPIANTVPLAAQGANLDATAAIWTGHRAQLLSAQCGLGRLGLDD